MPVYGNIAGWRAYALDRGNSAPTDAADTLVSPSLQRASDYIRTRYVIRLGLSATDETVVEATYIAAAYDLDNPGFWATAFTPSEATVLTKVEGISFTPIDVGSSDAGLDQMLPVSPAIDALFMGAASYGVSVFSV